MRPLARVRPLPRHLLVATASAALAASVGCSDDASSDGVDCALESRADEIVAGMEKAGDRSVVTFRLVSASPSPPRRPDNTWVMMLQSGGNPLLGATVTTTLFMPDHNHGTQIKPVISPTGMPGEYKFEPLNLWMPGLWEVTFEATPVGGSKDRAVFRVCIPD